MSRFAGSQPDLFAPAAPPAAPPLDPLEELRAMLARLRGLQRPPWTVVAAAMAEDLHALGLAKLAGPEGAPLAAAILEETERLMVIGDLEQQPAETAPGT